MSLFKCKAYTVEQGATTPNFSTCTIGTLTGTTANITTVNATTVTGTTVAATTATATTSTPTLLVPTGARVPATVVTTSATPTFTAALSGTTYICAATTGTQTITLPAAATAGLEIRLVCGHASGEIIVAVATGDNIVGKIHGAENATGISTTATTGVLKNTAATNVVGDHCTLVSDGVTTWYMTSVAGVWAAA